MGILIFFGIFFLISLVFGLFFSIILMNLRIIEIPPKYSWMNALIFIKRNAVMPPWTEARKDAPSQIWTGFVFDKWKMPTTVSGSITITTGYPVTGVATTTLPLEAILDTRQGTVISTPIIRPDYYGEEENLLSANRESNLRKLPATRQASDFQGGYLFEGGRRTNEANC